MSCRRVFAMILYASLFAGAAAGFARAQSDEATRASAETFRDWSVRCAESPDPGGARCLAYSRSVGAQIIVAGNAVRGDEEAPPARIVLHVPSGLAVGEPVAVYLDSDVIFQVRVGRCTDRYCEAPVAPEAVAAVLPRLVADNEGLIIYRLADNIRLARFSLHDFDKAWKMARP